MHFYYNTYDLYLFDLDGTLINTEELHYQAYNLSLDFFKTNHQFTFNEYCKYAHYSDKSMKEFIETNFSISYEKFYQKKKNFYLDLLIDINLMPGVENFLNILFQNNIKTCIVTHSDRETINFILSKLPILNKIDVIITKNDYINKKPSPEAYILARSKFDKCFNPIGFEDSYKGFISLHKSNITSVFVGDQKYPFLKELNPKNYIDSFTNILNLKINTISPDYFNYLDSTFDKYIKSLNSLKSYMPLILDQIIPLVKSCTGNIYISGIGKCGHVCKKSVSTWQSLGISCHYINIPDLFHGDFGILKHNDLIIYISNSGNTDELISCAQYIKDYFKICQVCFTINPNSKINSIVNFNFQIANNLTEIDNINMAPTTSSVLFMSLLDIIGSKIAIDNNLTIEKFKLSHPGGDLGKKTNNIIDYVVIVASGQGSRLYPYSKYIPKILVNFNDKPFIEHIIKYWKQYTENIILVINSNYKTIVEFYTSKYTNITIKIFDEVTGTADTIHQNISNEYYGKNILFSWCDIVPQNVIDLNKLTTNKVITFGNECRYGMINNKICKKSNGNIIGIYYIKSYNGIHNYTIGDDICDVFDSNYQKYSEYELDQLIDIGDLEKYLKYINQSNDFKTRFFNKITNKETTIIKESVCSQGDDIIANEISWYKYIQNKFDFIPKLISSKQKQFELEKLDAKPLYKYFETFTHNQKLNIISNILDSLDNIHQDKINIDEQIIKENIKIECYDKIYNRLDKIKNIISYFSDIKSVNNIKIKTDIDTIIDTCYKNILKLSTNEYSLIHGDCQYSNILYNKSQNKIYLIDPRGYFGKTKLYGPKEYDYAKLIYALTGYDNFNNSDNFSIDISNNNIIFDIESNYDIINSLSITNKLTLSYLIIIWIGLAQYNENNILKCIASYYNGIYLFEKYF
jgi:HAD superfamily hydrolase (TIGR01509 family)